MVEPDLEAIAALEPDLIIASPRTQKFVDKFKEIAPTVLFEAEKKTTGLLPSPISNP